MAENTQCPDPAAEVDLLALTRGILATMDLDEETSKKATDLLDVLAGGGTMAELHGLSPDDLELIYSIARTLYNNRKYDDALTMFRFLCLMDNMGQKWWMGLGATEQMLKRYEAAVSAYGYCTLLDMDDPRPQLQAGFCLMQMGRNEEALNALEGCLMSADLTEHAKIQAEALIRKLGGCPEEVGA